MDYRLLNNDPNYEKIHGLRQARSIAFIGKYALIGGVLLLAFGIISANSYGVFGGVVLIIGGFIYKVRASYLMNKYKD